MPKSYSHTETRGDAAPQLVTQVYDDATLAQMAADDVADAKVKADALAASLVLANALPVPPQVIYPGAPDLALMPDESVISVGPAGEVYRDGARLSNANGTASRVAKVVRVGTSVYGKGASNGLWYRWTGSAWALVTDVDPNILN